MQVYIKIQCDEGYEAGTLRDLAKRFEQENSTEWEYETAHAMVETYTED